MLAKSEMIGEFLKIALELAVRRIFRHMAVHRKIGELGHLLRRDQMRGLVHRRFRSFDVPQTADIGMQLESLKRNTLLEQRLGHRQPHRPGPDQRVMIAHVSVTGRICRR